MAQARSDLLLCLIQVAEGQQRLLKLAEETAGGPVRPSEGLLENAWSAAMCGHLNNMLLCAALVCGSHWLGDPCLRDGSHHAYAGSKPKVQALTLSQIEARMEDPTVSLKQLLKEHK